MPTPDPDKQTPRTMDAALFMDALDRAIEFQRNQPMNGVEVVIALTEVRDALKYAMKDTPKKRRVGK